MNKYNSSYRVDGMTCSGCSSRLTKLLERDESVQSADVNHETGVVKILGKIEEKNFRDIVDKAGFEFKGTI